MIGKGLLKGMAITLRRFFARPNTVEYPEEKLPLPPRFRGGVLKLDRAKCIACGLCAMACPNRVIDLVGETGEDKKKRLTTYVYHTGLCLYCNLCLEACPTQALSWSQDYEIACYRRGGLTCDCLAAAGREGGDKVG